MTDLTKMQEFVKERCGGLTLQHLLSWIGDYAQQPSKTHIGWMGIFFEFPDGSSFYWQYFQKNKNNDFFSQPEENQIAIAKLLGFKETNENN